MRAPLIAVALLALAGCGGGTPASTSSSPPDPANPELLGPVNAPTSAPHRRLPPLRACRVPHAADLDMFSLKVAGGAPCATAKRIAVRVSRASWERCEVHCAERYPVGLGYRCDAFSVGEADWTVDCRRGRRLVHMGVSD